MGGDATSKATDSLVRVLKHLLAGTGVNVEKRALGRNGLRGHLAFALLETKKGALGVGFETGSGVLIKVLGYDADEVPKLSAPVPISTSKLGVGISFGFNQVYTAVLLDSESEITSLLGGNYIVAKDVDLSGYENRGGSAAGIHSSSAVGTGKIVSVSDSFMICDFSLSGGKMGVDAETLEAVYGAGTKAEDVLDPSKVPTPSEFLPAYKFLMQNFMIPE